MSVRGGAARELVTWYGGGLVAAVVMGGIAASFHASGRAPVGILSLGAGAALGVALSVLAATALRGGVALRVSGRRLIVGTVALALVTVLAEHAWLYRGFRRQWHEARAKSPEVALFRPEAPWSPAEYFAHELTPGRAALWALDAALIVGAAVGVVVLWRRASPGEFGHADGANPSESQNPQP